MVHICKKTTQKENQTNKKNRGLLVCLETCSRGSEPKEPWVMTDCVYRRLTDLWTCPAVTLCEDIFSRMHCRRETGLQVLNLERLRDNENSWPGWWDAHTGEEKKQIHPQQSILSVHLFSISAYPALRVAVGPGAYFGCLRGEGRARHWQVNAWRQPGSHTSGELTVASSPDLHLFSTEEGRCVCGGGVVEEEEKEEDGEKPTGTTCSLRKAPLGGTARCLTTGCMVYCSWCPLKNLLVLLFWWEYSPVLHG